MVVAGDDRVIDQVKKQLDRLVVVIRITDLSEIPSADRELALVKVADHKAVARLPIKTIESRS